MSEEDTPVYIEDYDATWPMRFEQERDNLNRVLAKWIHGAIEHVGSTAVPYLRAKPIIDIMAPVRTLEDSRPAIEALQELSYVYYPYRAETIHWFCKPSPRSRTHHLHLVPFGSELWIDRLAFRDYLRQHAEVAAEYATLKEGLAVRHRFDREAYTEAKSPFVRKILALAR